MNNLKDYAKHFIDKLFFTLVSFKVQSFLLILGITSWFTWEGVIDGSHYSTVISVLITTVLVSREVSKHNYNKFS